MSVAERQANSVGYRAPSYGLFKTSLTPQYWYGIPRNVKADGLGMDVDRFINQRVDKNNNTENWIAFNRAQGARMSAMEHLVPEQMFSTDEAPAQGISTVKAIQLAAAEGQKIYTITKDNLNVALQQIELPFEIENEIRDAVGAGLEVTAHQRPVNFFSRQSVGYIIVDPKVGAGAYRIGGGQSGNETISKIGKILDIVGSFASSFSDDFMRSVGKVIGGIKNLLDFIIDAHECGVAKGLMLLVTFFILTAILAMVIASVFAIFVTGGSAIILFGVISAILAGVAATKLKDYVKGSLCK